MWPLIVLCTLVLYDILFYLTNFLWTSKKKYQQRYEHVHCFERLSWPNLLFHRALFGPKMHCFTNPDVLCTKQSRLYGSTTESNLLIITSRTCKIICIHSQNLSFVCMFFSLFCHGKKCGTNKSSNYQNWCYH